MPGKPLLAGRCVGPAGDGNAALAMMSSLRWNGEPTVGTRAPGAALDPNSTRRKPAGFSPRAVTNATHGFRFNLPSDQWREYSSESKRVDYQHRFAESLGFIAVGIGKAAWTESDLTRPLLEDKLANLDYLTRDATVTLSEDTIDGARVRIVIFRGTSAAPNRLPKRGAYAMRYVEGKPPVGILCLTSAGPAFTDEQILATVKSLRWADEGATR